MKRRYLSLFTVIAALVVITQSASAMYHPGMGRFMQRDPGSAKSNVGIVDLHKSSGFVGLDPAPNYRQQFSSANSSSVQEISNIIQTSRLNLDLLSRQNQATSQYSDGLNLYQYIRSDPLNGLDPSGRVRVTSIYGTTVPLGVCFGSCKCSANLSIPKQFAMFAAQQSLMGPCAVLSCNSCALGLNPLSQPVSMTACVQSALRAIFGSGVSCGCT